MSDYDDLLADMYGHAAPPPPLCRECTEYADGGDMLCSGCRRDGPRFVEIDADDFCAGFGVDLPPPEEP